MTVRGDPKEGEERGREREWRWSGECRRRGEGLGGKGRRGDRGEGEGEREDEGESEGGKRPFQRALVEPHTASARFIGKTTDLTY